MGDIEDSKGKILIIAALVIISALGVTVYYDEQGNIIVSNETHEVVTGNETKIIDERINENTTTKIVWEGTRTISDAITASVLTKDTATVLKEETNKVMAAVHFPYNVTKPEAKTTFKIVKYKCDDKMQICGYWIEAWRDGKEVYTNSPIWISPPPYQVLVSESFDEKTNEITTTLKEDPKGAVEATLQRYVEKQPLGKAVSYER